MSYEIKKTIHTECCCLHGRGVMSKDCYKRWFNVYNFNTDSYEYIGFCNEYLRLKIQRESIENNNDWQLTYLQVIRKELSNYIPLTIGFNYYSLEQKNDIYNQYLLFEVCERPHISYEISVKDAILHYLDNKRNYQLQYKLEEVITDYLLNKIQYKKYITKYKDCIRLARKISKGYEHEKEQILTELIINIHELNYKIK